ncbi:O-antigen ligase family protein [Erythrobacter sp. NE805]|uniref:O-antigen ligase family protein n=1 Tax=Erythrobacter sp. NE805 TaxID=3389875 RepID=UPI00396B4877
MSIFAPSLPAAPVKVRRTLPDSNRPIVALIPILIVFYAFILAPPETEFSLFGVRFFGYRLGVLLGTIPALWMTIKDTRGFLNRVDMAYAVMMFWIILSFQVVYGLEIGFVRAVGLVLDYGGSYFVARACIVTPNDLRRFLILIMPGLLYAGLIMAAESLSGHLLLRPAAASIFGNMTGFYNGEATGEYTLKEEFRAGLLRAFGPFDHPILGGTIMTGFLPLYYYSGLRGWPLIGGVIAAFLGLFSLSSAAFLGVMIMLAAFAVNRALPHIPKMSWWIVITLASLVLLVLHLVSTNGIAQVIARLTFSPESAYYRVAIWEYGTENVKNNPLFGLGYLTWERPSWMVAESVDAHFLLLAMRHGLLVPVVLLAGICLGMIRIGQVMKRIDPQNCRLLFGMNMAVIIYLIIGQTVTFHGACAVVFMSFIGFLASLESWAEYQVQSDRQRALLKSRAVLYARQATIAAAAA